MDDYHGISSIYKASSNVPGMTKIIVKGPYNITKSHQDKEACNDARKLKLAKTIPSRVNAFQTMMLTIESVTPSDPDDCEGAIRIDIGNFSLRTPFVPLNTQQYVFNIKFKIDLANLGEDNQVRFQVLKTLNKSEDQQEKEKHSKEGKFVSVNLSDFPQEMGQMEIRMNNGEHSQDIHDNEDEEEDTILRIKAANSFSSDLENHFMTDILDSS